MLNRTWTALCVRVSARGALGHPLRQPKPMCFLCVCRHHSSRPTRIRQFRSPILILLVAAAVLSRALGETTDALIISAIVVASGVLGFVQERGAVHAVNALLASVQVRCRVVRNGAPTTVPISEVVRGDVVMLAAGDVVPGDCRVLEANNLLVDESARISQLKACGVHFWLSPS